MKTIELGRIESLSPQGERIYAIVRRLGKEVIDVDGNMVKINTSLFRNEHNADESLLTLAELYIPTDINPKTTFTNYSGFIAREVSVEMDNGYPIFVYVNSYPTVESRLIPSKLIYDARMTNSSMSLKDPAAIRFLKDSGYDSRTIDGIINETYHSTGAKNTVISYGDSAAWHRSSTSESMGETDLSASVKKNIVMGLPEAKLKSRLSHIHPVVLSAK